MPPIAMALPNSHAGWPVAEVATRRRPDTKRRCAANAQHKRIGGTVPGVESDLATIIQQSMSRRIIIRAGQAMSRTPVFRLPDALAAFLRDLIQLLYNRISSSRPQWLRGRDGGVRAVKNIGHPAGGVHHHDGSPPSSGRAACVGLRARRAFLHQVMRAFPSHADSGRAPGPHAFRAGHPDDGVPAGLRQVVAFFFYVWRGDR